MNAHTNYQFSSLYTGEQETVYSRAKSFMWFFLNLATLSFEIFCYFYFYGLALKSQKLWKREK